MSREDRYLLSELRRVAKLVDPPPDLSRELGYSVFSMRRIDDEFAELVADTEIAAATMRAESAADRLLTFESTRGAVDLQITRRGSTATVLGQLHSDEPSVSGQATTVELETPGSVVITVPLDDEGRFEFTDVPTVLVRLRILVTGQATALTTAWFTP